MKTILTLVAALAVTVSAHSQRTKDRPEFGAVTPDELNMKSYSKDTAAHAVILFDIGSVVLDEDLSVRYKRHVRIKFFGTEDIDEFASKTLFFETTGESISKIKGATYNMENGKMVTSELDDDGIFKGKVDKYVSNVKFTLPNVKPGSIIEYSYNWTLNMSLLPSWQFQYTIPAVYSEYETIFPKAFSFRKDLQGYLPVSEVISKYEGNERLIMKDVPAFKVEPFLTTPDDYVSKVHYFITSAFLQGKFYNTDRTWPRISKDFDESPDFGLLVRNNGWLDKTVDPLLAGATTPDEKMKRIQDYVKKNIAFNDIITKWPDRTLKKVLDDKKGNSAEINMLMIAMMRRAELDAYPVLISTRDNGIIRPFTPYSGQFNDVICLVKIDGKNKLFDGTDKTLPNTALPERCLNGQGLIVSREQSDWVPLVSGKSRVIYSGEFKLNEEGEMSGKLNISRDGLAGGEMRSSYTSLGKEKYVSEAFASKSWEVNKSEFINIDGIAEMPKETHEIVIRDHVQANGDVMYINPYITAMEENKFKSEKREYPVDIPAPFDRFYTAVFELPAGFKVDELPANKVFLLPDGGGKFLYSATQVGNKINFTSQLQVTKNVITGDKYPLLREFYSMVVAKQAEQIVLKRIQ
jgi:hypothetical protein